MFVGFIFYFVYSLCLSKKKRAEVDTSHLVVSVYMYFILIFGNRCCLYKHLGNNWFSFRFLHFPYEKVRKKTIIVCLIKCNSLNLFTITFHCNSGDIRKQTCTIFGFPVTPFCCIPSYDYFELKLVHFIMTIALKRRELFQISKKIIDFMQHRHPYIRRRLNICFGRKRSFGDWALTCYMLIFITLYSHLLEFTETKRNVGSGWLNECWNWFLYIASGLFFKILRFHFEGGWNGINNSLCSARIRTVASEEDFSM